LPSGDNVDFTTDLVGICAVAIAGVCNVGGTENLYQFDWADNFDGNDGNVSDIERSNLMAVNPSTGTGGVTIISQGTSVPEPSTLALLAAGLVAIGWFRRCAAYSTT
jgi:hypothetical protein